MLNAIIQSSSYPLPKIQTIIANLTDFECDWFSAIIWPNRPHKIISRSLLVVCLEVINLKYYALILKMLVLIFKL